MTLGSSLQAPTSLPIPLAIPLFYAGNLIANQTYQVPIYSAVSNFDVVETVLCKIDLDFIATGSLADTLNSYLEWVLSGSKVWHYLSA